MGQRWVLDLRGRLKCRDDQPHKCGDPQDGQRHRDYKKKSVLRVVDEHRRRHGASIAAVRARTCFHPIGHGFRGRV